MPRKPLDNEQWHARLNAKALPVQVVSLLP